MTTPNQQTNREAIEAAVRAGSKADVVRIQDAVDRLLSLGFTRAGSGVSGRVVGEELWERLIWLADHNHGLSGNNAQELRNAPKATPQPQAPVVDDDTVARLIHIGMGFQSTRLTKEEAVKEATAYIKGLFLTHGYHPIPQPISLSGVERWDLHSNDGAMPDEVVSPDGQWVRFSDLERLTVATEEMKYFHVQLDWSQTEQEEILVVAESKEDAIAKVRATWPDESRGPKYVNCYHELTAFNPAPPAAVKKETT